MDRAPRDRLAKASLGALRALPLLSLGSHPLSDLFEIAWVRTRGSRVPTGT
jgi:hypothetical protein